MHAQQPLESLLRSVEPAVCLVSERHLRRLLRSLPPGAGSLAHNHEFPWWIERETVAASSIFSSEVLDNPAPRLLLITNANDRLLEHRPEAEQLRAYWRLLFQAAILRWLDLHPPTFDQVRESLTTLGPAAVREIRHVLELDHAIEAGASDAALYRAFVVVYQDLVHFAPASVADVFPSLPKESIVRAALPALLDATRLQHELKPPGAADAIPHHEPLPIANVVEPGVPDLAKAQQASRKGNHVRAAILYARVPEMAARARLQIKHLVSRIAGIVHWNESAQHQWIAALTPLLGAASRGTWSRAARCLYELQKIPTDLRGELFAVDLVEWMRTLGRRPIRRPLPRTRYVILLGHLRAAEKQLLRGEIDPKVRERIEHLLRREIHETELLIREELGPILTIVLHDCGLRPKCTVEEVARDKLVAELLDRICARGYLRIGDLRDCIARNQLKMPDLAGPVEFFRGDPLLKTDVRLAYELDGIHRRGEFYLRGIQRLSSLFFGTPWGRLITLYLAIPFGGAFLSLMFAEELRHLGVKLGAYVSTLLAPKPNSAPPSTPTSEKDPADDTDWAWEESKNAWYWRDKESGEWIEYVPETAEELTLTAVSSSAAHGTHHGSILIETPTVIGFGVFLLLMLHVPPFRRAVFRIVRWVWNWLRRVFYEWPLMLWRSPPVRFLRDNAIVRFVALYLGGPILLTILFVGLLAMLGAPRRLMTLWGGLFLVVAAITINTRLGWLLQDRIAERLSDAWRLFRVNLVPGIIGAIIGAFKALVSWVETTLYHVDESLRFQGGDSRLSLVIKAIGGLVWFPIAYVTRFVFYLLIEPQVNPVKHFPVVTVSHKVVWPMLPDFAGFMSSRFAALGFAPVQAEWYGGGLAAFIINGCPGIFGFIAWELKENWRLYQANRPTTLRPVTIGSHGESMRGLLRPGFHSGTLPKAYRKLRRAWREDRPDRISRGHHDVEHVAEAVEHFAKRELLGLLRTCPEWAGHTLEIRHVRTGCQRMTIVLGLDNGKDVILAFENRNGQIEASFENEADLKPLDVERLFSLRDAAAGFFNLGAANAETAWRWDDWVKRWQRG